jgi:hypothetical protein
MLSKLIPAVAATFSLGLAAMGVSAPAKAGVVVGVDLPVPYLGVGYRPYGYGRPYYRGFAPYGLAYRGDFRGYRGYRYYGHGYAGRRWR